MASKYVEDTIEAFIEDDSNWSLSDVYNMNEQWEAPTDGTPFLMIQFVMPTVRRAGPTTRTYIEEGGVRLILNVERGTTGKDRMRTWGDVLAPLFTDRKVGEVECLVPTEPFTDDESDQGNYFQGAMIIPYRYVFNRA
jgi:hypothetical protein